MANRYWRNVTGNWSSSTNWSTTNGGGGGASVPTDADDVFFTSSSGSGVCTVNTTCYCKAITTTGFTGSIVWNSSGELMVAGNITIGSGTTIDTSAAPNWPIILAAESAFGCTITSNGKDLGGVKNSVFGNAAVTLADALTVSVRGYEQETGSSGSFTSASFAIAAGGFSVAGGDLTLGTSVVTLGSGGLFSVQDGGSLGTVSAGSATIKIDDGSFRGGGFTYGTVWFIAPSSGSVPYIQDNNTIGTLRIDPKSGGRTLNFVASSTQTITSAFDAVGSAGNLITLQSDSGGNAFTLSKSSGTITADYCSIKDSVATGGATWNATNSVDGGGNSGWNFISNFSGGYNRALRSVHSRR